MYVVTYKGKPQTVEQVGCRESQVVYMAKYDDTVFHTGRTKSATIDGFLFSHGFTWPEWEKDGYELKKVKLS